MTKRVPALTVERALWKIAEVIGWAEICRITGKHESTVRSWSDPDAAAGIKLADAIRLDVAYHAAGGEGAPLLQVYQARFDAELSDAVADRAALCMAMATVARLDGEAIRAGIVAAQPGSTHADLAIAVRDLEVSIAAEQNALGQAHVLLRNSCPNGRAPEVAPPAGGGAPAG